MKNFSQEIYLNGVSASRACFRKLSG